MSDARDAEIERLRGEVAELKTDFQEMDYALLKLTEPWATVETVAGRMQKVDHEPLIDMLETYAASSITGGGGQGGLASERSVIDVKAFQLLADIGTVSAIWLKPHPPARDTKLRLISAVAHRLGLWRAKDLLLVEMESTARMVETWADRAWDLFNRPREKEILASCPECEKDRYYEEGVKYSALVAYYLDQAWAECRVCGARWDTREELVKLGFSIRANSDTDTLRELGLRV